MKEFLLSCLLCLGLRVAAAVPTDTLVTYRDVQGRTLAGRAGAKYLVKSVKTDSTGGNEWVYGFDGYLHEHATYVNLQKQARQGVQREYYEKSHQLKVSQTYQNEQLTGELLSYYPGGQLKRRERYLNYVAQGGECFNEAGAPISFVPYVVMPEFEGGLPQMMSYIQQNVQYPQAERRAGHVGRVLVGFVVDKEGRVRRPVIVQSVAAELDAEALRVVRRMPRWKPGMVDGERQNIGFTLPVTFVLQ